jgi:hypothetical protein
MAEPTSDDEAAAAWAAELEAEAAASGGGGDALAAEWEAMVDADAGGPSISAAALGAERILNQAMTQPATKPVFVRSSTRRSFPTNACRCSRWSSIASCV